MKIGVYKHIEADPVILARGGFITVCGLGGIVLGSKGSLFSVFFHLITFKGGVLRQIAYGSLGAGIGTTMCYPNSTLKAINYAWDASTSKIFESAEKAKRKFKGNSILFFGNFFIYVLPSLLFRILSIID